MRMNKLKTVAKLFLLVVALAMILIPVTSSLSAKGSPPGEKGGAKDPHSHLEGGFTLCYNFSDKACG